MTIVAERTVAPRPLQRPSEQDVRSSEFGIDDMPVLQPHPSSLPPERTGPRRPRPGSDPGVKQVPGDAAESNATQPADGTPPTSEQAPSAPVVPQAGQDVPSPPEDIAADEAGDEWGAGIL
jgi:hypothetical protein